jgi:hypothetical protein
MHGYLNPGDPGSFLDCTVRENWDPERLKYCPVCRGHCEYNLKIDAYGPGRHFRGVCAHCNGSGLVDIRQTCDEHVWKHTRELGRCYNEYTCVKCGAVHHIDSGD